MGNKYWFDSFGNSTCSEFIASGTVASTGEAEGDYVAMKVLTNSSQDTSWIGQKFWCDKDAKDDGSEAYQLYTYAGQTATGVYVKIYAEQPSRTVSITVKDSSDDSAIQGATVTIGETSKTTGSAGGCSFTLKDGEYEAEISAEGYTTATETIDVAYDSVTVAIELTAS